MDKDIFFENLAFHQSKYASKGISALLVFMYVFNCWFLCTFSVQKKFWFSWFNFFLLKTENYRKFFLILKYKIFKNKYGLEVDTYEVVDESPDAISQLKMRHPHGLLFQECEFLQKHKQNANVVLALLHFAAGCGLKMDESRNFQTSRVLKNSVESSTRWSKHPKYSINESESIFSLKKCCTYLSEMTKKFWRLF